MRGMHKTAHQFVRILLAIAVFAIVAAPALSQVNTVDLSGSVLDPQGLVVANAKIAVRNLATGATRTAQSGADGRYQIVGLSPGRYELTVEAKGFANLVNPELVLTIGAAAEFEAHVSVAGGQQTVTVTGEPDLIETRRTSVAQTVSEVQIDNLPINGRNYINFTLLDSQVTRDSAPSIGAAPTSGLNFGGQRARSNEVSVDGADAVDNGVNGIRATVSQEAVQEFQIINSNYMPEFGRAMGGVVNIVTKSGSNETHGDIYGFLRQKDLQARNPFSVEVEPDGDVVGVKQSYTRVQAGATLGGPIQKDKTFYFLSYETTRRQETGFTDIGAGNFGFGAPVTFPFFPAPLMMTPTQQSFVNSLLGSGNPSAIQFAEEYALIAGSASNVALNGIDYGVIASFEGTPTGPGPHFPFPIDCGFFNPATPCSPTSTVPGLPASYVPLNSLIGNYPIKEGTSLWSARLDHNWNASNNSFLRVSISPSLITGIQVNAQNQNFGENAGSRTSLQQTRDLAVVLEHVTTLSAALLNEFLYQWARRGLHYGFSELPGGSDVAENITGYAFFGREPFSTVDRIEKRNQLTDSLTWIEGKHTMKFGADFNMIQLGSSKSQIFELNFGGLYDFGSLSANELGLPSTVGGLAVPSITAVQAYGLGLPGDFIQGIGHSDIPFNVPSLGVYWQDSWKMTSRLTLNYGLRYDIEFTPIFTPGTPLNAIAEPALKVVEGIPVSKHNFAPRVGLAWDPTGSGKTAIRASYGLFYDHPLLALAFDSTTADGALSSQLIVGGGTPTAVSPLLNPGALNAASIFQGVLNTGDTCASSLSPFGYLPCQQRFNPFQVNSIFTSQNFMSAGFPIALLPFTLPTAKNFVYAYAQQANLGIAHELGHNWKLDIGYNYTHGVHLSRPRNVNTTNPTLLTANFANALAAGFTPSSPISVDVGSAPTGVGPCSFNSISPILGVLSGCAGPFASLNGQYVSTAAAFNFFRPSGPNPSFATAAAPAGTPCSSAIVPLQQLAALAGYPTGPAGVCVPWSDVVQQESSGNSLYNGLTVSLTKRFSKHFQLISSWTYSHAIDDSTDLQTLLEPQDNNLPQLERGNSTFDQRHRWITSAVFLSPYKTSDQSFLHKFFADFVVSPIMEIASGRPYTVLTGTDTNLDFSSETDRPSVVTTGLVPPPGSATSASIPGVAFTPPTSQCPVVLPAQQVLLDATGATYQGLSYIGCIGDLGRNTFVRPGYFSIDMRISRKFALRERMNLEIIAEGYNLLNRFNAGDVNPLCDPTAGTTCTAGQVTAANDPRTFQFALKLNW